MLDSLMTQVRHVAVKLFKPLVCHKASFQGNEGEMEQVGTHGMSCIKRCYNGSVHATKIA